MSQSALAATPESPARSRSGRSRPARSALLIAVVIVTGAWFVSGRSGIASLGRGGINSSYLPRVGQQAPDFITEDLFGNPVRLSDFRGRPVWLMFWGSWCPPCRAEMPDIVAAYSQLKPQGLVLLGVSVRESAADAASYAAKNDANFSILSDPDEADTGHGYPLFNVPTHLFIDADGAIRSVVLSDMSVDAALAEGHRVIAAGGEP